MRYPVTVCVFKDNTFHDLALMSGGLCVDCRFNELGECKLFGVRSGVRPAVCLAAEGEARARKTKALKELAQKEQM